MSQLLIHLPLVGSLGASATELIGIHLATCAAPVADRFVEHEQATCQQSFFTIASVAAEPDVPLGAMPDDLNRKAVVLVADDG